VLADYTSEALDLDNPAKAHETFRDLSKPVGALNPARLQRFIERRRGFEDPSGETPSFLYGSHYSNMVREWEWGVGSGEWGARAGACVLHACVRLPLARGALCAAGPPLAQRCRLPPPPTLSASRFDCAAACCAQLCVCACMRLDARLCALVFANCVPVCVLCHCDLRQGTVLFYLLRMEPFATYSTSLQGGKLDHADRLFHSIPETWTNCLTNPSDLKELTPEFFFLPDFLRYGAGAGPEAGRWLWGVGCGGWCRSWVWAGWLLACPCGCGGVRD
jgi:hypothetical protein